MEKLKWKDCSHIVPVCEFKSRKELEAKLLAPDVYLGPKDHGTLSMIVLRPTVGYRYVINQVQLSAKHGVHGSGWSLDPAKGLTDQVCVMPTRVIQAVADADDPETWPPAGDQLFLDFDMTESNISPGDRVRLGEVELEMTTKPHRGCMKFIARYGADAMRVINCPEGRRRRLRGIYFHVVKDGIVRVGDPIVKLP